MKKDKLKGFISGVIVTSMLFALSFTAFAASGNKTIQVAYDNIKIYVNEKLTPMVTDGQTVEPFTYQGRTYVPLNAVATALGQKVGWDGNTNSVYIGTQPQATTPKSPDTSTDELELSAGNYVAGTDFAAGTYNILVIKGSGNVYSTNMYSGGLNEIMGDKDANLGLDVGPYATEFKNASFPSGVTLTITDNLVIKLTKVK